MSVFGGDSWAREAQCRNGRVADLLMEGIDASAYKKLPNCKFLCLLCPHRPVIDTPLMLSMHIKGSCHRAAESQLKEKELSIEYEISKRITLAGFSVTAGSSTISGRRCGPSNKPLIERVQKAALEIISGDSPECSTEDKSQDVRSDFCYYYKENPSTTKSTCTGVVAASEEAVLQQLDYRERCEKELKFTATGWKRDGHRRWYKDKNVVSSMSSNVSLRCILDNNKLTSSNFLDWIRNVRIVLRAEKIAYVLDTKIPPSPPDDAFTANREAFEKHKDDAETSSCIMLAAMNPEFQKQYEHMDAHSIFLHLSKLFHQ